MFTIRVLLTMGADDLMSKLLVEHGDISRSKLLRSDGFSSGSLQGAGLGAAIRFLP